MSDLVRPKLSERLLALANAHILERIEGSDEARTQASRDAAILREIASEVKLLETYGPSLADSIVMVPATVRLMEWLEKLRKEATPDGSIPTLQSDVYAYGTSLAVRAEEERQALNETYAACQSQANGLIGMLETHLREVRRLAKIAIGQPTYSGKRSVRGIEQFQAGKDGLFRAIIERCNEAITIITETTRF